MSFLSLLPLVCLAAGADTTPAAPADSAAIRGRERVVRQFPAVEVRALLHDLRSSEIVHEIPGAALRSLPVEGLAELVALQPGVVAQGEELHVRGGRAGETLVSLDGMTLDDPQFHRPMELPLLAVRSAELVSGAPESRYAGALAGVLDLHTVEPGERASGEWRWQSDGGLDTRYDRLSALASAPIAGLGIGLVAAGDATLDNTSLPALRTASRHEVAGIGFGWRADNRMLGLLKLASIAHPQRFALQVMASRSVHEPYDPAWSLDGWTGQETTGVVVFSPVERPGFVRYRAADHLAITDDRRFGVVLTGSGVRGAARGTLTLGWLRTRTGRSLDGSLTFAPGDLGVVYGKDAYGDAFHVILGNDPLVRASGSDAVSLRGDVDVAAKHDATLRFGAGASVEDVRLDELDASIAGAPLDFLRSYRARAPGGFAYGQGRWQSAGMVLNAGLRAEYFTAGPEGDRQTLPGGSARLSLSPRLGIAYPISVRDVLSMSYVRVEQPPERDLLYDQRTAITNRQPLGNPALRPARMIGYEAAVKHLISATTALQASFFYRDAAFLAGARNYQVPGGPLDLRYTDDDQASSAGLELSLVHARGENRRLEAHYTFMHAWGYESRPEGDPYGPVLGAETPPISEQPLSWDRRHSVALTGLWGWGRRVVLSGTSQIGSPLPWTPKPRRQPVADVSVVNSRRFRWTETTSLALNLAPPHALGLTFGLEVRNLFDDRGERAATVDGYPNPVINTLYDDYGAYRTETGLAGGAYWTNSGGGHWVPVHDPRLLNPPRTIRASVGRSW